VPQAGAQIGAVCADYLKRIAPPQAQLIDVSRDALRFLFMVFLPMIMVYDMTGPVEWLPRYLCSG
jgi:TRAP-type mannitol/chloroaromatic compound transport system permease large subunit